MIYPGEHSDTLDITFNYNSVKSFRVIPDYTHIQKNFKEFSGYDIIQAKALIVTEENITILPPSAYGKELEQYKFIFLVIVLKSSPYKFVDKAVLAGYRYIYILYSRFYVRTHGYIIYNSNKTLVTITDCCSDTAPGHLIKSLNITTLGIRSYVFYRNIKIAYLLIMGIFSFFFACSFYIWGCESLSLNRYISNCFVPIFKSQLGNKRKYKMTSCFICLEPFAELERVIILSCYHEVHQACFYRVEKPNKCPLCKSDVIDFCVLPISRKELEDASICSEEESFVNPESCPSPHAISV